MQSVKDGICRPFRLRLVISILLAVFLSADHSLLMGDADESNSVLRARAYKFSYITSQQAQEILSQLNIGESFDQLSENALIVASDKGSDLIKATEVLSVLDQPKPVAIRVLLVGTDRQPLPDIDVLSARMRAFTVGTLREAPPKGTKNPIILDVLNNKLIAIGAEELLPEVQKEVDAWKEANPPGVPSQEPLETQATVIKPEEPAVEEAVPPVIGQPEAPPAQGVKEQPETAAGPAEVEQDLSLQELMTRLLEQEDQTAIPLPTPAEKPEAGEDDLMGMLQTEPNTTEDYISDELLKVLLDEEEKSRPKPAAAEPEVAVRPEAEAEPEEATQPSRRGEEKTLKEAIDMLLQRTPQEKRTAQAEPQTAEAEVTQEQPQRSEAVSENLRLQRELAILRQRLAELQAQKEAVEETETVEPEPEAEAEEPEPKILTEEEPTLTEFEKQVGEANLETVLDIPQEVELENLVDLVGKQLGLNYMYDPTILRNQKVFLKIHRGQIKVKDLYGLLESVMRFRGFVMTRRDDLVTIIKSADASQVANQVDTVFRMPNDPIQPGDIIVSTIFRLDHVATGTAKTMLTSMKLGLTNGFQEIPETNTLIVTDYAYRMPRIEDVLEMIDVAGEEKVFKYRALKYMQVNNLVEKLKELIAKMEGVSMQTAAGEPAQPTRYTTQRRRNPQTGRIETVRVPVQTQQQQAASSAAGEETVFIDTDERTNRILMIGTPTQIETINQLIDTLDVPLFDLKFVREYVIQNVEAIEVVNVLNELGLANLQVSGAQAEETARSAAARRAAAARAARGAQPNQPQPAAATPSAPSVSGSEDQPNISIRPATNSLLVNGTEEQHQAIELVIAYVDVVQKDQRTIKEYEIQYVDTQEIIDTMTELGIISQGAAGGAATQQQSRMTARTSRAAQQQPAQPEAAAGAGPALAGLSGEEGAAEDITAQEPQIAVLEATNSLLVYATPRQHKAIALLIAHADRVPETTTTPYVVYALENQDPLELSEVLTKLIQETVEEIGKTSTPESRVQTAGGAAAGGGAVPSLEEQKIRIIPDEMSYSLIVYANKRNQQWIAELIDELDEYRPQVLLDCTLVEVTQNEKFQYDLDLISKTYGATDLRSGIGAGALIGQLQSFTNDQFGDARSTTSADPVFKAFFNSANVQALLTAIQSKGYGRVMARPKILVNDNQEGEIKTENTISVAQLKSNIVPTSTGTASTAVTTTDVSFNDYNAGVTLTIKPHISKGNMLRLEITLNRTDFTLKDPVSLTDGGTVRQFPSPPDRLSTDVTTVSTVPDGTTIILGGLETITQSKGNSKVPILGDIPIIGGLFRGVTDTGDQSRLYVFVKANILRPSDQLGGLEDIRRVSSKYRREFEEMEENFQSLQDWPGIKPKPMEPVNVLKEDEIIELSEP